jgi:hypothetical protein
VWVVLSFIANSIPFVRLVLGLVPPALLGFFQGGWQGWLSGIVICSVIKAVSQSAIQPAGSTLFCKALLVEVAPTTRWSTPLISPGTRAPRERTAPEKPS